MLEECGVTVYEGWKEVESVERGLKKKIKNWG